jgi:hypothetical protein
MHTDFGGEAQMKGFTWKIRHGWDGNVIMALEETELAGHGLD